jgi:tetratricopeptide (TPR) repeat protein
LSKFELASVEDRYAVVAYGANRNPATLSIKLLNYGYRSPNGVVAVPALRARMSSTDVVACGRLKQPEGWRPGRRQRSSGHYRRRAIWHYWRATRENPRHYVAYNNWGNLYLNWAQDVRGTGALAGLRRARRLRRGRSKFEKAISIQPAYHHAHDNLGNAYAAEQRYAEAERCMESLESVLRAAGCVCPLAPTRPARPEGHILQR